MPMRHEARVNLGRAMARNARDRQCPRCGRLSGLVRAYDSINGHWTYCHWEKVGKCDYQAWRLAGKPDVPLGSLPDDDPDLDVHGLLAKKARGAGFEPAYVESERARARVVKGWAFMDLDEHDDVAVERFLRTGLTAFLPLRFQRADYSIYEGRV